MLWHISRVRVLITRKHQLFKSLILTHKLFFNLTNYPRKFIFVLKLATMSLFNIHNGFIQFLDSIHYTLIAIVFVSQLFYHRSFASFTFELLIAAFFQMVPQLFACSDKFAVWCGCAFYSVLFGAQLFEVSEDKVWVRWEDLVAL